MILNITRINGGLNWDKDRYFTNESLETGYEKLDDFSIHCELDYNIIYFDSREVSIDSKTFNNSQQLIDFLFNDRL